LIKVEYCCGCLARLGLDWGAKRFLKAEVSLGGRGSARWRGKVKIVHVKDRICRKTREGTEASPTTKGRGLDSEKNRYPL